MQRFLLVLGLMLCVILPLHGEPPVDHAASDQVRLPGHVLPALTGATPVPATPGVDAEPLTLTLVLKRDDQAGFEQYLHDVYDSSSPSYRRFLTQSELSDRFGPSREVYDGVLSYLQNSGFTLVEGSANRLTLTIRGARAQAERAFALHVSDYKIGDKSFHANDTDPALPTKLASHVAAVAGLSNLAVPKPQGQKAQLVTVVGLCTVVRFFAYFGLIIDKESKLNPPRPLTPAELQEIENQSDKLVERFVSS